MAISNSGDVGSSPERLFVRDHDEPLSHARWQRGLGSFLAARVDDHTEMHRHRIEDVLRVSHDDGPGTRWKYFRVLDRFDLTGEKHPGSF
jgi:hypothetical protein